VSKIVDFKIPARARLKCPGVRRDKDNENWLCFYFDRRPTDNEMRFLHDVMKRAAETMPRVDD
jgi:hypothetical protein